MIKMSLVYANYKNYCKTINKIPELWATFWLRLKNIGAVEYMDGKICIFKDKQHLWDVDNGKEIDNQ